LPALDEVDRDIGDLRDFATRARKRKKELEKTMGAYERGIEPVLL
jgi:hypothetical protein